MLHVMYGALEKDPLLYWPAHPQVTALSSKNSTFWWVGTILEWEDTCFLVKARSGRLDRAASDHTSWDIWVPCPGEFLEKHRKGPQLVLAQGIARLFKTSSRDHTVWGSPGGALGFHTRVAIHTGAQKWIHSLMQASGHSQVQNTSSWVICPTVPPNPSTGYPEAQGLTNVLLFPIIQQAGFLVGRPGAKANTDSHLLSHGQVGCWRDLQAMKSETTRSWARSAATTLYRDCTRIIYGYQWQVEPIEGPSRLVARWFTFVCDHYSHFWQPQIRMPTLATKLSLANQWPAILTAAYRGTGKNKEGTLWVLGVSG